MPAHQNHYGERKLTPQEPKPLSSWLPIEASYWQMNKEGYKKDVIKRTQSRTLTGMHRMRS